MAQGPGNGEALPLQARVRDAAPRRHPGQGQARLRTAHQRLAPHLRAVSRAGAGHASVQSEPGAWVLRDRSDGGALPAPRGRPHRVLRRSAVVAPYAGALAQGPWRRRMSLRDRAIRAVSSALYHSRLLGPVATVAGYARPSRGFPILTFHRVNDDHDPFLPAMPTAVFAARIAHIARHYRVLTVEDLVERVRQGTAPRNALALTFDDGYRDTLTHAAPILAEHGLPSTIFLATGYIGTPQMAWFDRVALAFKLARRGDITLPARPPPPPPPPTH